MLWDAKALIGQAADGCDGAVGLVSDLLFDDVTWSVRWIVIDTGSWLPGRKVLLPPAAFGKPDSATRRIPITLTTKQVKDSPDVDTDMPISRQLEARVYNHYGWAPYWEGAIPLSNAIATPLVVPLNMASNPSGLSEPNDWLAMGNPHLRSVAAVTGYHIHAMDGELGHAEDFLVDDVPWKIRYILVDTKNWWPGKRVLVAPRSVRDINWSERVIYVDAKRQAIRESPAFDPQSTADGANDASFLTYFGAPMAHA